MCVSMHDARFGQTEIAGWRFPARRTHCVLYGCEPQNLADGPNALMLHVPLAFGARLTQDNFIPTQGLRNVLADMWAAAPKYPQRVTRRLLGGEVSKGSVLAELARTVRLALWVTDAALPLHGAPQGATEQSQEQVVQDRSRLRGLAFEMVLREISKYEYLVVPDDLLTLREGRVPEVRG
jgi:hypothetical protein